MTLADYPASLIAGYAHSLRRRNKHKEALKAFNLANSIAPGRTDLQTHIGLCLESLGQRQEALSWFHLAADARVLNAADLLGTAHGFWRFRLFEDAFRVFRRAYEMAPANPRILIEYATMLREKHHTDEAQALLEGAQVPDHPGIAKLRVLLAPMPVESTDRLGNIVIGTTGTCNASCVHCPTGKAQTDHVPRIPMPMPLFRHLIDNIADSGIPVLGQVGFGLFGDGLVDPFVVERAEYVRRRLPDAALLLNTNGAAYDPKRHAKLNKLVSVVSLHCESLNPETYNYLMAPLRAERVHAKYPMIFRDFPGKVRVAVPLSRVNHGEMENLFSHFMGLGAQNIDFAPLSARCARDQKVFDSLSFDPEQIYCPSEIMQHLIIDCDGTVLACCNDFEREVPVGKLTVDTSLADLLSDHRRREITRKLAAREHNAISTCQRCRADTRTPQPDAELTPA